MRRHWVSVLVCVAIVATLLGSLIQPGATVAQDEATPEPTPTVESSAPAEVSSDDPVGAESEEPAAGVVEFQATAESPTTEPETVAGEPPTETPAATETPAEEPSETATAEPTAEMTSTPEVQAAAVGTLTFTALDVGTNQPLAHACVDFYTFSLGIFSGGGCTDEQGGGVAIVLDPGVYDAEFSAPPGYAERDSFPVSVTSGEDSAFPLQFTPLATPTGTETLLAVDAISGDPVGGACWSYYLNMANLVGPFILGPVCDDDGDGAAVAMDVPVGRLCAVIDPPDGYTVSGSANACANDAGNRTVTKSLWADAETQGAVTVIARTPWGTALANVCVKATPVSAGAPTVQGCTGADGRVTLTGLYTGEHTVSAATLPQGWQAFAPVAVAIAPGPAGELAITVPFVSGGSLTYKAVVMYGPKLAPGGCIQVTTRDGGQPGNHVIAEKACDDDLDGTAFIPAVPNMRLCLVVDPPPGFFRPKNDYAHCFDSFYGDGVFTIGFREVPKTPTPRPDTPTPAPTFTPTPTRTPAPDEGNVSLTVQNCVASITNPAYWDEFTGCQPAPAGVRLRLIEGGEQIATLTTNANGAITYALAALTAYRLEYLDGNGADWIPGSLEESRLRYGQGSTFSFVPRPEIDTDWTMVVRVQKNPGEPVPGGCAKIVDYQHPEITLLPEQCDTDGDGEIVVGTLPARPKAWSDIYWAYGAVLTSVPEESGYRAYSSVYFGAEPNDLDFRWVATPALNYVQTSLKATFVDAISGEPVSGICLQFEAGELSDGLICDGNGDGIVTAGLFRGLNYRTSVANVPPGYLQPAQLIYSTPQYPQPSPGNQYAHVIEFTIQVQRDGSWPDDSADVAIFLKRQTAYGDNPFIGGFWLGDNVCLTISPVPQGTLATRCTTTNDGTLFFVDLPAGSYTFTTDWRPQGWDDACGLSPDPFGFTVTVDDLGKLLARTFTFQCRFPDLGLGSTCFGFGETVARNVDVYWGTLRDPETGEVIATTVQFSEAVSEHVAGSLLDPAYMGDGDKNPAPDFLTWETVKPWTERGSEAWVTSRDWDGDARQRAIDFFKGVLGGPVVLEEETEIAVTDLFGGVFSETIFNPTEEDTEECPGFGNMLIVITTGLARVRFVEVSAIPAPPSPTPTATPDGTSTPTPTVMPEEEPVCISPLVREVSLAYGTVRDGNAVVDEGVAVSDLLPPEVVAAILAGDPPDAIADGLEEWADDGLDPFDWAAGTPSGTDPTSALLAGFGNATAAEPEDGGWIEYVVATRIVASDEAELPEGCVVAAWGLLYPIEEQVIARVHVTKQDATVAGKPEGTVTPTPVSVPSATATAEADGVTSLPNTGARPAGGGGVAIWFAVAAAVAVMALAERGRRTSGSGKRPT